LKGHRLGDMGGRSPADGPQGASAVRESQDLTAAHAVMFAVEWLPMGGSWR